MLIKKVQKGQPITADMINNLIDSIRECQICSGTGYSFRRGSGGTTLSIKAGGLQQAGGALDSAGLGPFDVTFSTTTSGLQASVHPGLVNGVLPSGIFDKYSVSTAALSYISVSAGTNGSSIIAAQIMVSNEPPLPVESTANVAPSSFGVLISIVSAGISYRTIPAGNILARITPTIQVDAETYVAGKRNFVQYFSWIV